MVTITFKKMELLENHNTVKIVGDCFGHQVTMEISILQLAKIFGTDKEISQEVENDFGSTEYEDKCDETREYVKKFPEIKVWNNELEFGYVSVEDQKWVKEFRENKFQEKSINPKTIGIYAEDIVGWDNEGIRIDFPKEIYDKDLKGKEFRVFVSPFSVDLRIDKE